MGKLIVTSGILGFGLFMVWVGGMVRIGKLRWLFFGGGFPVLAPVGAFLITIPMGLGVITIGFMTIFPGSNLLGVLMLFFGLSAAILSFWLPDWILPMWLSWLRKNYDHVLDGMFEEVRQMGVNEWEKETRTQAELERWADSVAQKHGWQRLGKRS